MVPPARAVMVPLPGFKPGDEVEVLWDPKARSRRRWVPTSRRHSLRIRRGAVLDSLPSFYRNNYSRWLEGAKRPETRAKRVAELVDLTSRGIRER